MLSNDTVGARDLARTGALTPLGLARHLKGQENGARPLVARGDNPATGR